MRDSSCQCVVSAVTGQWFGNKPRKVAVTLVHELDNGAVPAIQKARKLAKVGSRNVVIDGVEVSVVGRVQRIYAQPEVMSFVVVYTRKRNAKLPIQFQVQRKECGKALSVRYPT